MAAAAGPVLWDGKDLAAIQMATCRVPRVHGRPAAEVDRDWHLTVCGHPLMPGDGIEVAEDGTVTSRLQEEQPGG